MSLDLATNVKSDEPAIADRLVRSGMSAVEAHRKDEMFARAFAELDRLANDRLGRRRGGAPNSHPYLLFVPGRVEILGKHTDYAGGKSLLATVERGFCIAALPRADHMIQVADAATSERVAFEIGPELAATAGHWSNYPMTVGRRVARNFSGPTRGADIAFISDLPPDAGMSSSSAMMTGIFKTLAHVNRLADRDLYRAHLNSPENLAGYLATIENGQSFGPLAGDRGVGTFGGSEDHTALCCCRPGQFLLYSFCPVRWEATIPMPAGYMLAIAASGVSAQKTGDAMAKYNRVSRRATALLGLWHRATGRDDRCLAGAIRSAADAPELLRQIIADEPDEEFRPESLANRLEQFLGENEHVVPAAVRALAAGQIDRFGTLVDQSQHLAERFLENQVPQTICLARVARQCGAAAASAFGAGFGGSVWALVKCNKASEFLNAWSACYGAEFPVEADRATFFLSAAGPSMVEL